MAPPVTGATPQFIDTVPSALCTTGHQALNVTGFLLWTIRRHFSLVSNIKDAALQQYIWAPQPDDTTINASESNILIEPVTKVTGQPQQFLQMRPAVLVKRNSWTPKKLGIADWVMPFGRNKLDMSKRPFDYALDTANHYEVLVVGSHTIFCIGGTGGEAEALGTEVFYELLEFAQLIRADLDLERFQINEVSPVAKLEESKEHYVVAIDVFYSFFHAWKLTLELPEAKGFAA